MRVVIHGGMHKTGTKSLQHLLRDNRSLLLDHGILYPDTGLPQHGPILNPKRPDWSPATCGALLEAAHRQEATTLLLSAEAVCTLSAEQFEQLASAFQGCDLSFLFCFRHWADFLPSRWTQNCHRCDTQGFEAYVATVSEPAGGHPDFWFDGILSRACESGEAIAVSYQNAEETPGGVIAALLRAAGFTDALAAHLSQPSPRRNTRVNWLYREVGRLLNGIAADRMGLRQNDLCNSIGAFRHCDISFALPPRLGRLDASLFGALGDAVKRRKTVGRVANLPHAEEALHRLQAHACRFANLADGAIFPRDVASEIVYADMDWRTFEKEKGAAVDAALEALREDRFARRDDEPPG